MAVGVSAGQLGGDLGAVHRATEHVQIVADECEIVAREMEHLLDAGVAEQSAEIGARDSGPAKLHQVAFAVARRELHEAQPVAMGMEAHRLGVYGHNGAEIDTRGQVVLVQVDPHVTCIRSGPPPRQKARRGSDQL